MESRKEGELTITVADLREKPTRTGGTNYQIWGENGEMYSTFTKPGDWDELREGDEVLFEYEKSGDFNNIVEGTIEVLEHSEKEKRPRTARGGAKKRKRTFGLTKRELMVKWVSEAVSRTLQSQEEITEEKLDMVFNKFRLFALGQLGLPLNIGEEEND